LYADFLKQDVWVYYASFLFYIVFPFRDLFICACFAYLYYYQGMKKEKRNNEIDDPIRDFDTVDLKDLLNRETPLNMATSGRGMTEKNKQSFAYIGSMGNQSIT
jgi:hypothetical protein